MKLAAFVCVLVITTCAGAADCLHDAFIDELFAGGDGFRAVTILKEREFQHRHDSQGWNCARRLLASYIKYQEYAAADQWLDLIHSNYPAEITDSKYHQLRSELAYIFGNQAETMRRAQSSDFQTRNRLVYFSEVLQNPWVQPAHSCSDDVCRQLDQMRESELHGKSPRVALALGLIPGMGQIYAGRITAGITSFVTNSLLIAMTIYAAQRDEQAFEIFSGVAAGSVYVGSIYAGYEATQRFNDMQSQQFRERAKNLDLHLGLFSWKF